MEDPGALLATCVSCGEALEDAASTLCFPCLEKQAAPRRPHGRRSRGPIDLSQTTVDELVRDARQEMLRADASKAAQLQRTWERMQAWYGPGGLAGLEADLRLPLVEGVVEALLLAELKSLGIDTGRTYSRISEERIPLATLESIMASIDFASQMAGHPPAWTEWKRCHVQMWRRLSRAFLTRHARHAASPLMLDEQLRFVAWLMAPTPRAVRLGALMALALDDDLVYEGTGRAVSWAWLASLRVDGIVDLGRAGMRCTARDQGTRTVVLDDGATARALRRAVGTRLVPLRDDAGRTVVIGGDVQKIHYTGPLWTTAANGPLTGQDAKRRVAGILRMVVPNLVRVTVKNGRGLAYRVDHETRERAVDRAIQPESERLRDAAWLANGVSPS